MNPWLWAVGGLVVLSVVGGFLAWAKTRIRYAVGRTSLRILCFGMTLRQIPFSEIERISKPRREGGLLDTESWVNTWDPGHREMVVHVRSGWRRRILITPRHRYAFRSELRAAMEKAGKAAEEEEEDWG
jgi:hypothetical protein